MLTAIGTFMKILFVLALFLVLGRAQYCECEKNNEMFCNQDEFDPGCEACVRPEDCGTLGLPPAGQVSCELWCSDMPPVCNCEQSGDQFCNYDGGCEECPNDETNAPCFNFGLPENGVRSCLKYCEEPADECVDDNEQCPSWASGGECEINPDYMLQSCRLSCEECIPTTEVECIDVNQVNDNPGVYTCDCVSASDPCLISGGCEEEPQCPNMDGEVRECIDVNHFNDNPGLYTCGCVSASDDCLTLGVCEEASECPDRDGEVIAQYCGCENNNEMFCNQDEWGPTCEQCVQPEDCWSLDLGLPPRGQESCELWCSDMPPVCSCEERGNQFCNHDDGQCEACDSLSGDSSNACFTAGLPHNGVRSCLKYCFDEENLAELAQEFVGKHSLAFVTVAFMTGGLLGFVAHQFSKKKGSEYDRLIEV